MTEWFEDEAFWELLEPFLFPNDRIAAAAEEVSMVLELTDSSPSPLAEAAARSCEGLTIQTFPTV